MNKIGIITFHNAHNYGAMLQVYALQNVLNDKLDMVEVKVINYENKRIMSNYKVFTPFRKNLFKYITSLACDVKKYKVNKQRYNKFDEFMNKELALTKSVKHIEDIEADFDVCITGSDQVWNTEIVGDLSNEYTLNFGKNDMRRISYAASVGDVSLVESQQKLFKEKINRIDNISVREADVKCVLEKLIEKEVEVVLDPTLLMSKYEWDKKLKSGHSVKEKYILAYEVKYNEEYLKIVNFLSRKTGLKVIHFANEDKGYENVLKSAYTEGPLEFVELIKNAEYIIATSFHATVFSIIYEKKFFVVPHIKTGARVTNLLDKLSIKNRDIKSLEEFKILDYKKDINYDIVGGNLEKQREKSIKWLVDAIEN